LLFTTQAHLVTAEHDTAIAEFTSLPRSAVSPPPNCDCRYGSTTWTATTNAVKDKSIGFAGGLRE
jgi:hypothetical protein